jgi:hypothetical protein
MFSPEEIVEKIKFYKSEADHAPTPRVRKVEQKPMRILSGGIARTTGGRIWATWIDNCECRFSHPVAGWSDDDGITWTGTRYEINELTTPGGLSRNSDCSNLWLAPNGDLWWIFDNGLGVFDGQDGIWASVCKNPDGLEPEWSCPEYIWYGHAINKPVVLRNGDWLIGCSFWLYPTDDMIGVDFPCICGHELDHLRMAHILASSDQGKTWARRGGVKVEEWSFNEPNLVERQDGSLLMYLRTSYGIAESVSVDGGCTWSEPERSKLMHPPARIATVRLKSGKLLMIKHAACQQKTEYKREKLSAYLSDDDGKTWYGKLMLDERDGVSYPDGFQDSKGRIYVIYDHVRTDGEILMAVFEETDVIAGKVISPNSRLKQVIHRLPGYVENNDESFVHIKLIANQ